MRTQGPTKSEWPIFVSYRRSDRTRRFALELKKELEATTIESTSGQVFELDVFVDVAEGHQPDFQANLVPHLKHSRALIVLADAGAASRKSSEDYFYAELDWWAAERRKTPPIILQLDAKAGNRLVADANFKHWRKVSFMDCSLEAWKGQQVSDLADREQLLSWLRGSIRDYGQVIHLEEVRRLKTRALIAGILAVIALVAFGLALVSRDAQVKATQKAVDSGNAEKEQRLQAERALYRASIGLADFQLTNGRSDLASKALNELPVEQREWEWGFLSRKANGHVFAAELVPGDDVGGVVLDGGGIFSWQTKEDSIVARAWLPLPNGELQQCDWLMSGASEDARVVEVSSVDKMVIIKSGDYSIACDLSTGRELHRAQSKDKLARTILDSSPNKWASEQLLFAFPDDWPPVFGQIIIASDRRKAVGLDRHGSAVYFEGRKQTVISTGEYPLSACFSEDGNSFVVACGDGTLSLHSCKSPTKSTSLVPGEERSGRHVHSCSVHALEAYDEWYWIMLRDGAVEIIPTSSSPLSRSRYVIPANDEATAVAVDKTANVVAIGCRNGMIYLYEGVYPKPFASICAHVGEVAELFFHAEFEVLWSIGGQTVKVWSMPKGWMPVEESEEPNVKEARLTDFLPSSKGEAEEYLADLKLKLPDAVRSHNELVNAVGYTATGKRAATGGEDGVIRLWNCETRELLLSIPVPERHIFGIRFSRDGRRLWAESHRPGDDWNEEIVFEADAPRQLSLLNLGRLRMSEQSKAKSPSDTQEK